MNYKQRYRALLLVLCVATGWSSYGDGDAKAGRKMLAKHQGAVVTVQLVLKQGMVYSGRDSAKTESISDVTGTVISPDGLTLISLAATDPSGMYNKLLSSPGSGNDMRFESELSDVKLTLPDGRDVPAKVVLRDRDLDLAFIRPDEPLKEPLPYVNLKDRGSADVLDSVIILNRLGRVASRAPAVSIGKIAAIVEKPRTFYILDQAGSTYGLGTPVFTTKGKVVGMVFLRSISQRGGRQLGSLFGGTSSMGVLPVIVPVEDILDSAQQVPERESSD